MIDRAEEHLGPERAGRYLRKFYPWYTESLEAPAEVAAELQRSADLPRARDLIASLGRNGDARKTLIAGPGPSL